MAHHGAGQIIFVSGDYKFAGIAPRNREWIPQDIRAHDADNLTAPRCIVFLMFVENDNWHIHPIYLIAFAPAILNPRATSNPAPPSDARM